MADEPTVLNFAGAINDKVMESIKNMDVITMLQKMVASTVEDEESEDIRERLQGVMKRFYEMSPEEQNAFSAQLKQGLAAKLSAKLSDPNGPLNLDVLGDAIKGAVVQEMITVGVVAVFLVILFVFFGYKLYKSIREKERKKEDKKKAKQQKKKK